MTDPGREELPGQASHGQGTGARPGHDGDSTARAKILRLPGRVTVGPPAQARMTGIRDVMFDKLRDAR